MSARPRRVPFLLTMMVTLIILGFGLAQSRAAQITCQIGSSDCPAEITAALFTLKGKSLIWSDVQQQVRTALQNQTAYRLVAVRKEYPDIVRVSLEPQRLEYQFLLFQQDQFMAINDQGRVVPLFQLANIPSLVIPQEVWDTWQAAGEVPAFSHEQLKNLPEIIRQADVVQQGIMLLDDQTMIIYLPNNQTALVDIVELDSDIPRLKTILTSIATQELSQPIEEIDLRYKLPVLRFTRSITRHESL